MNKRRYRALLLTQEWKVYRLKVISLQGAVCCKCGATKYLQVHHLKYTPSGIPWESPYSDCIVVCRSCHKKLHSKPKRSRRVRSF